MSNSNFVDLSGDDETGESNSACPTPISRQFWKAGNYKIAQRQGHKATNKSKSSYYLYYIIHFVFSLLTLTLPWLCPLLNPYGHSLLIKKFQLLGVCIILQQLGVLKICFTGLWRSYEVKFIGVLPLLWSIPVTLSNLLLGRVRGSNIEN